MRHLLIALLFSLAAGTTYGKIAVCHLAGSDHWIQIEVSENAWPAHEAHGDFIIDADHPCPPAEPPPIDPPPIDPPPIDPPPVNPPNGPKDPPTPTPPVYPPFYWEPPDSKEQCRWFSDATWLASCTGLDSSLQARIGAGWITAGRRNTMDVEIVENSPLSSTILADTLTFSDAWHNACLGQDSLGQDVLFYLIPNTGFGVLLWTDQDIRKCELRLK